MSSHPLVVERFEEGAVALHLETGACFRLNETAAAIAEALVAGLSLEAIAEGLATRFDIAFDEALSDVVNTRAALDETPAPKENEEELHYDAAVDPHLVLVNDAPALRVHLATATLEAVEGAPMQAIHDAVDGVLPKLLALRGFTSIHASAVHDGTVVRAFSGASFAGKTTTAHAFAHSGANLVSEDVVVLRIGDAAPSVLVDAEARARAFGEQAKRTFDENPQAIVDFSCLDELRGGPTLALGSILFLDEHRREGSTIRQDRLAPADSLVLLFRNLFLASMAKDDWQRAFERMAKVARQVPAFSATMPRGLDALYQAALASSRAKPLR